MLYLDSKELDVRLDNIRETVERFYRVKNEKEIRELVNMTCDKIERLQGDLKTYFSGLLSHQIEAEEESK